MHRCKKNIKHEYRLFHNEIRNKSINRVCIGLSFFDILRGSPSLLFTQFLPFLFCPLFPRYKLFPFSLYLSTNPLSLKRNLPFSLLKKMATREPNFALFFIFFFCLVGSQPFSLFSLAFIAKMVCMLARIKAWVGLACPAERSC